MAKNTAHSNDDATSMNDASPTQAPKTPAAWDAQVAHLSYEEARSQLVEIVAQLEQGSLPLAESLDLWELGEALARRCQAWLDSARARLNATQGHDTSDTDDFTGDDAE